jgi:hypothetical protein
MQPPTSRAPAFLAFDRRSRNGAVIGHLASHPSPPFATATTISYRTQPRRSSSFRRPRGAIFSYPVCRSCHMNLPPGASRVDPLDATLKRQNSSFHQHQGCGSSYIRGQTTLLACKSPTSPLPRIPRFHRRSGDNAVIGQFCLHNPVKDRGREGSFSA